MSGPARFIVAGLLSLSLIVSHAVYRALPAWRGDEICLPASLYPDELAGLGYVGVDLPAERLRFELSTTGGDPSDEFFQLVRVDGPALTSGDDVIVQLEVEGTDSRDRRGALRAVSVSAAPLAGATNVAGRIYRVDGRGHAWLTFGSHHLPAPPDIVARARPREIVRELGRPPSTKNRAADAGTCATFRVLPSGRAALTGLLVDGRRIE